MDEVTITTAAKLYNARKAMKSLLGPERYAERMAETKPSILRYAAKHNVSTLHAAIELATEIQKDEDAHPGVVLLILSCAVEMAEESDS